MIILKYTTVSQPVLSLYYFFLKIYSKNTQGYTNFGTKYHQNSTTTQAIRIFKMIINHMNILKKCTFAMRKCRYDFLKSMRKCVLNQNKGSLLEFGLTRIFAYFLKIISTLWHNVT